MPHAPPMAPACRRRVRPDRAGGLLHGEGLLGGESAAADVPLNPMAARPAHFAARAKRVIWIFINGGPEPGRHLGLQAGARALARQVDARVRPVVQEHDRLLQGRRSAR